MSVVGDCRGYCEDIYKLYSMLKISIMSGSVVLVLAVLKFFTLSDGRLIAYQVIYIYVNEETREDHG